LFRKLNHLNLK